MMKFIRMLELTLLALLVAGCATESIRVQSLNPQEWRAEAGSAGKAVGISPFKLNTGKPPNSIGEAKTGTFNTRTPIISSVSAERIVTDAVESGLKGVGISVSKEAPYRLEGTVERLWVDEYATGFSLEYARASVKYDVYLRNSEGKTLWAKTIESFKASEKSADATESDIPTLTMALQESVRSLVEDPGFRAALLR